MSSSVITQSDGSALQPQNQILVQTLQARFVACAFRPIFLSVPTGTYGLGADQQLLSMTTNSLSKTTLKCSTLPL